MTANLTDRERLEILAAWHAEQARETAGKKRRSPWMAEQARQIVAHHQDAAASLRLIAHKMKTAELLPPMQMLLLNEAVTSWPAFDTEDDPVSGGDIVEWFSDWRARAKKALAL